MAENFHFITEFLMHCNVTKHIVFLLFYFILPHMPLIVQEAQLSLGWTDRTAYVSRPASNFRSRKESDFLEVTTVPYTPW